MRSFWLWFSSLAAALLLSIDYRSTQAVLGWRILFSACFCRAEQGVRKITSS